MVNCMLHILLNSPYDISISSLLLFSNKKDDLICIQDGVLLGILHNSIFKKIYKSFNLLYLLQEDVQARGLTKYLSSVVTVVSYSSFVFLTASHSKNMTW